MGKFQTPADKLSSFSGSATLPLDDQRLALRQVCLHSANAAEAQILISMLGLDIAQVKAAAETDAET